MEFTLDHDAIVVTERMGYYSSNKTTAMIFDINHLEKSTEIEV